AASGWWPAPPPPRRWSEAERGTARGGALWRAPSLGWSARSRRRRGQRIEVEREPHRRERPAEAAHQIVVATTRSDSRPRSRDEDLEVDARVVVETAHLAEVVHDVVSLASGQGGVDRLEPRDRTVRSGRGVDHPSSTVERLAPADDERQFGQWAGCGGGQSGGVLPVDQAPHRGALAVKS